MSNLINSVSNANPDWENPHGDFKVIQFKQNNFQPKIYNNDNTNYLNRELNYNTNKFKFNNFVSGYTDENSEEFIGNIRKFEYDENKNLVYIVIRDRNTFKLIKLQPSLVRLYEEPELYKKNMYSDTRSYNKFIFKPEK